MTSPDNSEIVELQIAEVVSQWMECSASARPSIKQLIDLHPNLAPGLEECLKGIEQIEQGITSTSLSATVLDSRGIGHGMTGLPTIPDFELLRELGRGGMGVVYEARQISLDRVVALKVLPFGSIDTNTVKRFLREAETVASLTHSSIVPVYSVGVDGGLHWYAMQRIDGCTLSQWFAVATFPSRAATLAEVVRVGVEAADALQYAHGCGVIHRDVKPSNLLVDTAGKVWLADFGLARRDVDVTATATGAMLGTPRYMSSEQVSGLDDQIDARTDIYSLGATLYEMATGRPPFTTESPLDLLMQIRNEEPTAPRTLDPSIPRTLEIVILKCLDKEAERRYQSAAALADDLRAIRDEKPIKAQGLPAWVTASRFLNRYRTQVKAIGMTAAVTLASLASLVLLWRQYQSDQQGYIRIDTPTGLYVASIQTKESLQQPEGQSMTARVQSKLPEQIVLTTPMQQTIQLPAGDYVARLAGTGNTSQEIELAVQAQRSSEFRYIDRRGQPAQVDIHQKLAVPLSQDILAVLGSQAFEVFDPHDPSLEGMRRFSVPISLLDEGLAEKEGNSSASARTGQGYEPLTFAFNSTQNFQGDHSVGDSGFARIHRIASNQVDLDGDGRLDFLITAARHAAIAAVSSKGILLWKKRLSIDVQPVASPNTVSTRDAIHEAIVGIDATEDIDGDGTLDLVLNTAAFDPAGGSHPHLCTLSGRTGSQLSTASFPTIAMNAQKTWPLAGVLRYQRYFNNNDRYHRHISHHQFSMRSETYNLGNLQWAGMMAGTAIHTLPNPIYLKHNGSRVAVTATAQQVHTINLENGSPACPPIQLNEPIQIAPRPVKLANGKVGVMVVTSTVSMSCTLHLCELGEPKPLWSIPQTLGAYDLVAGASASTLPAGIDLNGDGVDEILTTSKTKTSFVDLPFVECYDSANGRLLWQSQQIAGISQIVERLIPVGDVDGDNLVDLAAVGLNVHGTSGSHSVSDKLPGHDLRLTIDFLSGKNGQRLGFREERLVASVKNAEAVEIDFAKLFGQELVCSIVYGSADELELSSASITVDLTNLRSPLLFPGLTALKPVDCQTGFEQGSWFRNRSGPYASPSDNACWIEREAKANHLQNQTTLAAWTSQSGHPRIVLLDQNSVVRCIDPTTGSTIWQDSKSQVVSALVHQRSDGQIDLVSRVFETGGPKLALIESETGRVRFSIHEVPIDRVLSISPDQSSSYAYCYVTPEMGKMFMAGRKHFWLMKIDLIQGKLIWAQECLEGIDPNGFTKPAIPIQCDINQDNVTDLIVSNTQSGELIVQAIDGRDGRSLWVAPLNQSTADWPSTANWPMMQSVRSGDQEYLLVVDKPNEGDSFFALKSIRLSDGKKCDEFVSRGVYGFNGDIQSRNFAFHEISRSKRDGMVGLATPHPLSNSPSTKRPGQGDSFGWNILKIDESKGTIKQEFAYNSPEKYFVADVDGDGSLDSIDVTREGTVAIRPLSSGEPVGSFSLPKRGEPLRLERIDDTWYLVVLIRSTEFQWMELPTGRLAARHGQGLQSTSLPTELPKILTGTDGHVLVGTTPESTVTAVKQLASENSQAAALLPKPIAMISTKLDSRYRRPVTSLGMYRGKSLAEIVRLALLASGAILLPVWYLFRFIRYRQWSLQSMLLAPAITLVALVCWRSLASVQSNSQITIDVIAGTMAILSVLAVCAMLHLRQWKMLGITVGLSVFMGTLIAFGAQSVTNSNSGIVAYWTFGTWLSSVCAAAAQIAMPLAIGQAVAHYKSKMGKAN